MPLAPPVTMAVRPDNLPMLLSLRTEAADEVFKPRKLLLDQVDGGLILELERLLVEFLRGKRDENLGAAEQDGVDRGERLPQMILHAGSTQDSAGGGLQRDRLSLNGWSFMRDTQSMAFFRPPGIDQLYSGETTITPSALRIASAHACPSAGKPVVSWIS